MKKLKMLINLSRGILLLILMNCSNEGILSPQDTDSPTETYPNTHRSPRKRNFSTHEKETVKELDKAISKKFGRNINEYRNGLIPLHQ